MVINNFYSIYSTCCRCDGIFKYNIRILNYKTRKLNSERVSAEISIVCNTYKYNSFADFVFSSRETEKFNLCRLTFFKFMVKQRNYIRVTIYDFTLPVKLYYLQIPKLDDGQANSVNCCCLIWINHNLLNDKSLYAPDSTGLE